MLHDNAPAHTSKLVKNTMKSLGWDILPYLPYSPDLVPSDYHHFTSMGYVLAEQHLKIFEEDGKWLYEWFAKKEKQLYLKDGQSV